MSRYTSPLVSRRPLLLTGLLLSLFAPLCAGDYNVRDYGAVTDDETVDTPAIQAAIDACADAGGGKITIPAGTYLVTPIMLRSNVNVEVCSGATLLGSTVIDDYPVIDGRWEGIERKVHASMFTGQDLHNVSITGRGTLNARGQVWWEAEIESERMRLEAGIKGREPDNPPGAPLTYMRPRVINLYRCTDVLVRDITILDSPSWTVHPVYCDRVTVDNITIKQPLESPNTDGINPDSCTNVRIVNCYIEASDDCVTIKSGYNADGRRVGLPCENIVVANCIMAGGLGGVVIGSEMSGGVRNVVISNCIFRNMNHGLRLKTARGRGGVIEDIRASSIVMQNIKRAFRLNMYYDSWSDGPVPEVDATTPRMRNITFSDITVNDTELASDIIGLPEMPLENLTLRNIRIDNANTGMRVAYTKGLVIDDLVVNAAAGVPLSVRASTDVTIRRLSPERCAPDTPVVQLEKVAKVLVQECDSPEGASALVGLFGESNTGIETLANHINGDTREVITLEAE